MFQTLRSALHGPARARSEHRKAVSKVPGIIAGIEQLSRVLPVTDRGDEEAPIFLLAAGWRSGSTLLQRLIMSDSRVLIWGEPYDESGVIQALSATLKAFREGWPPQDYFYDGTPPEQLTGDWIANLFPSLDDFHRGHRALFDVMFAAPALRAGATRWGLKEVRLGAEHCAYLRWLYPKARFVLLYRNPLEAYRSYCRYGRGWYDTFPDHPVFTPTAFGRHWRSLMEGFLRDAATLGALLVRYEDLVAGRTPTGELEEALGIRVDPSVLQNKVGSSERGGRKTRVSRLEKWLLKRAVAPVAEQVGYHW